MPDSDRKPSETGTPHVVYETPWPRRPWIERFTDKTERILAIRETLKRAG